jgi:8-oxo-dGTP pyrophosphatase MutT (NUDIX family)
MVSIKKGVRLAGSGRMTRERSAGAIVFRKEKSRIFFLVLKHGTGFWGFPKGLVWPTEKVEEAAKREVKEETGLEKIKLIPGFKKRSQFIFTAKYPYQLERGLKKGERVLKTVTYFLAESKGKKVKLSFEHNEYAWLEYKDAVERLSYQNDKDNLKKAFDYIISSTRASLF